MQAPIAEAPPQHVAAAAPVQQQQTQQQGLFSEPRFMPAGATARPQAHVQEELYEEEFEQGKAGFFSRVADVGRALSSRGSRAEVAERIQVVQHAAPQPEKQVAPEDDQYLDIPAFLRRQAN